jgi:hypothetical protein
LPTLHIDRERILKVDPESLHWRERGESRVVQNSDSMPRINSKQSSVKIQIEGQSDDESDQDEELERKQRERRGKAKREKPSEIEVCSCPTCSRLFMRARNEQVRTGHALPLNAN